MHSLEEIEFRFNTDKLEFKPLKKYNTNIHSIRFGSINKNKGFINHTDYSVIQLSLDHSGNDSIIFKYENKSYIIAKKEMKNKGIIKFIKL